jgi:Na+/pantothenate symporter
MSERWPYATRPWISAYCAGALAWAVIADLCGAAVVIALLAFGVLSAAGAARWLDSCGDS